MSLLTRFLEWHPAVQAITFGGSVASLLTVLCYIRFPIRWLLRAVRGLPDGVSPDEKKREKARERKRWADFAEADHEISMRDLEAADRVTPAGLVLPHGMTNETHGRYKGRLTPAGPTITFDRWLEDGVMFTEKEKPETATSVRVGEDTARRARVAAQNMRAIGGAPNPKPKAAQRPGLVPCLKCGAHCSDNYCRACAKDRSTVADVLAEYARKMRKRQGIIAPDQRWCEVCGNTVIPLSKKRCDECHEEYIQSVYRKARAEETERWRAEDGRPSRRDLEKVADKERMGAIRKLMRLANQTPPQVLSKKEERPTMQHEMDAVRYKAEGGWRQWRCFSCSFVFGVAAAVVAVKCPRCGKVQP